MRNHVRAVVGAEAICLNVSDSSNSRSVDPTEEAPQVSGNCHEGNSQNFDGKTIEWQDSFHETRRARKCHVPNQPYH